MGHRRTLITAPTAAKLVSPLPLLPPRVLPLSLAPSVTILTCKALTITALTLATPPAFINTLTSTHPGGPTAAQS